MLVIIFYFLEFLPFVFGLFYFFVVYGFRIPFKTLLVVLIRVVNILLPVILIIVIVESITVKSFKEYPFQNIPHEENNNGRQY